MRTTGLPVPGQHDAREGAAVAVPGQVAAWIRLDAGQETHVAGVPGNGGGRLFARAARPAPSLPGAA